MEIKEYTNKSNKHYIQFKDINIVDVTNQHFDRAELTAEIDGKTIRLLDKYGERIATIAGSDARKIISAERSAKTVYIKNWTAYGKLVVSISIEKGGSEPVDLDAVEKPISIRPSAVIIIMAVLVAMIALAL